MDFLVEMDSRVTEELREKKGNHYRVTQETKVLRVAEEDLGNKVIQEKRVNLEIAIF